MQYTVTIERPTKTQAALKVRVPAAMVSERFKAKLVETQKVAKLKGFRPGHVPMAMVQQVYGRELKDQVFHNLVEDSYTWAVREKQLRAVGKPVIDAPQHHHHEVNENEDIEYTATVDVMPEFEVKGYHGVSLVRKEIAVTPEEVTQVIGTVLDDRSELISVAQIAGADGQTTSIRGAKTGDYLDLSFDGKLVTANGLEARDGMKGERLTQLGSGEFLKDFEDNLVGLRGGESKTFRVRFPENYGGPDLSGQEAEFTVTLRDLKEKNLPELSEELAKELGYESVEDFRTKAHAHLLKSKTQEEDRNVRNELLKALIERNPFDLPENLVRAQARSLAQDFAANLKERGFQESLIQDAVKSEEKALLERAETQVRSGLILEAVARAEKLDVTAEDLNAEIAKMADENRVTVAEVREYLAKDAQRFDGFRFHLMEEKTIQFLLKEAKIRAS